MKRCWFGLGLLVVILAISLGVTWGMVKIHEPIAADLRQAAQCGSLRLPWLTPMRTAV